MVIHNLLKIYRFKQYPTVVSKMTLYWTKVYETFCPVLADFIHFRQLYQWMILLLHFSFIKQNADLEWKWMILSSIKCLGISSLFLVSEKVSCLETAWDVQDIKSNVLLNFFSFAYQEVKVDLNPLSLMEQHTLKNVNNHLNTNI
jgi:hypothetical protein